MPLTFGELFAGIGGFGLGFERAGMECRWNVEIDPYCQQVLKRHWPNVGRWDDVRTFPPDPAEDWEVDVICAGFPCQDISYAGRGAGLAGERSGLFFEAVRVVRELRPRIVVLENVAALLTRGLDVVLGTLAEIGFDAEWHCIPAAAVGAPHIRDRVFVLGYASGATGERDAAGLSKTQAGVSRPWAFNGSVLDRSANAGEGEHGRMVSNSKRIRRDGHHGESGGTEKERRVPQLEGCGRWETEPGVGRVADGVPNRVDRIRALGNAVVPQVAHWIGRRIVDSETET